ncbi:MAG: DNA alkylation repair enzyme [Syntrophorhabdus sp. PtaU1.Bin153]|nr:MAG: DNA alkylation repair enzyme [Syntrophorhabdus sp. PtaU1.Bin153]
MNVEQIQKRLQSLGDPKKAEVLRRFFKTGPGEYGNGDIFAGITVPEIRKLSREYETLSLPEISELLRSPLHESRTLALLLLIRAYKKGDVLLREKICDLYLENTRFVNNWDLVDISAEHIVGSHFRDHNREPLHALAASSLLWERRIAIVSTFHYIKQGDFTETLHIADLLLKDREDLIHKAVGWMLREVGKRSQETEESFLKTHYKQMPRTMLRYAIERFPEDLRQRYLKGEV